MNLVNRITALFDRTVDAFAFLAGALIGVIVVVVSVSVVARYFFNISWVGLVELSSMSLLFITFLGTTWVLREESHTTMDFVLDRLSPWWQSFLNMVTSFICIIICLFLVWYGTEVTWTRFVKGTFLFSHIKIQDAYFLFIIPVGSFFLAIQFLRRSLRCLHGCIYIRRADITGIE